MASFGTALAEIKRGGAATRTSWPAELNMSIQMHVPGQGSAMTQPYLYISVGNERYPWLPAIEEMLAEDWDVVKKSKLIIPKQAGVSLN